jgi:tRNA dimethylallyltransferase
MTSGKKFSEQRKTGNPLYEILEIGINLPQDALKRIIKMRIEQMIKGGLVREVKRLIRRYGYNCKAFDAIGYREIIGYLRGKTSLTEAVELMNKNTWHYAKRQMTWFRRNKGIHWVGEKEAAIKLARSFVGH